MIDLQMQQYLEDIDIRIREIDNNLMMLELAAEKPDVEADSLEFAVSGIRRMIQGLQDYVRESGERIGGEGIPGRNCEKVASERCL